MHWYPSHQRNPLQQLTLPLHHHPGHLPSQLEVCKPKGVSQLPKSCPASFLLKISLEAIFGFPINNWNNGHH